MCTCTKTTKQTFSAVEDGGGGGKRLPTNNKLTQTKRCWCARRTTTTHNKKKQQQQVDFHIPKGSTNKMPKTIVYGLGWDALPVNRYVFLCMHLLQNVYNHFSTVTSNTHIELKVKSRLKYSMLRIENTYNNIIQNDYVSFVLFFVLIPLVVFVTFFSVRKSFVLSNENDSKV